MEGNNWNDCFWGVCGSAGRNWLGRILMEIRQELAASEPPQPAADTDRHTDRSA